MSLLTDEVDVLRRSPLFKGVETPQLKLIAYTGETIRFDAGEMLFRQGDPGDSAFVILSGEVAVLADSPIGPIELARLGQHEIVGEIGILCDVPRTATVKALTPLRTLRIAKECLGEMLDSSPRMALAMLRELAQRLSRTSAELVMLRGETDSEHDS